jgi:Holliday junction resolvase RusA-like endonuclease
VIPVLTVTLRGEPEGRLQPQPRIVSKNGRMIPILHPATKTKRYQRALALSARVARGSKPLLSGAVVVIITAVMGVPKSWSKKDRDAALAGVIRPTGKPDWDNFGKQLDAFKGVIWGDDAAVVDGRVIKVYGEEPMLRVEVLRPGTPLEAAADARNGDSGDGD